MTHTIIPLLSTKQIHRFWTHVLIHADDDLSICWTWTGAQARGYGKLGLNGKIFYAHRVAYAIHSCADPGSMKVLHNCDNPICVRPSHLKLGTQAENIQDCVSRNRFATKLTASQVGDIRERIAAGERVTVLSKEFGVRRQTISMVKLRRIWKHV